MTNFAKITDILSFFSNEDYKDLESSEEPRFQVLPPGLSIYVLSESAIKAEQDLSIDCFSPWSGSGYSNSRKTTKTRCIQLLLSNGYFVRSKEKREYYLKIVKNTHVNIFGLKRSIYSLHKLDAICAPVLYVYEAEEQVTTSNMVHELPSDRQFMKKALDQRTTTAAKRHLAQMGYNVPTEKLTSLSRGVNTHIKSNRGAQPPLDVSRILDRYFANIDPREVLEYPVLDKSANGSIRIRILACYPMAIRCFASGLPTRLDLHEYRGEVEALLRCYEDQRNKRFNEFLATTTKSGNVPCIGSALMVDTTFSLSSAEYVTIMIGVNDVFRSRGSGKNQALLLGIMIHSKKELEDHEHFSRFMNDHFTRIAPEKSLGLIIHDGESSFRVYNSGTFLKDAYLVRCDAHRIENMKEILKKDPQLSIDEMKTILYGQKRNFQGQTILRKGVLQNLSSDVYEQEFNEFLEDLDEGPLKNWLLHNKQDLFLYNSMASKLKGGWPLQFLTSNIIESRNAFLKLLVPVRKPAEMLLDDFLNLHGDEMQERLLCVSGKSHKIESDCSYTFMQWTYLSLNRRRELLESFGISELLPPNIFDKLPLFVLPNKNIDTELLCREAEKMKMFRINNDFFVKEKKKQSKCAHVELLNSKLSCYSSHCEQSSVSVKLCLHRLLVLNSLTEEERTEVIDQLKLIHRNFVTKSMIGEHTNVNDGRKIRRRGNIRSKTNHSRTIVAVMNDTNEIENSYRQNYGETMNNDSSVRYVDTFFG